MLLKHDHLVAIDLKLLCRFEQRLNRTAGVLGRNNAERIRLQFLVKVGFESLCLPQKAPTRFDNFIH